MNSANPAASSLKIGGVLLIDKVSGPTSHDILNQLRKKFHMSEVGHCGTLDPLATGLLVMLLGEATKLSNYLLDENKAYRVQFKLGISTETWDRDASSFSQHSGPLPGYNEILRVLEQHLGELEIQVPDYSAIKRNGKKLMDRARRGEKIDILRRSMKFYCPENFSVDRDLVSVDIHCSKGSYIRSWVWSIGKALGVGATVWELRRLRSGTFSVDQASSVEDSHLAQVIPLASCLPNWPEIVVNESHEHRLRNGLIPYDLVDQFVAQGPWKATRDSRLICLISTEKKILRVFN